MRARQGTHARGGSIANRIGLLNESWSLDLETMIPFGRRLVVQEGVFLERGNAMSRVRMSLGLVVATVLIAFAPAGIASAMQSPTTGQPGTTAGFNCGSGAAITEPGNAAFAAGSAFNEVTPGHAGTVYAGNGPGSQHAGSTAAVSQYDSACRQLTSH